MPKPIEICLEELDRDPEDENFIRCVALPGGEPGLALDREGAVQWMPEGPGAYGLWVSADDRLTLLRSEGTAPITVERGARRLEAPADKPVILCDQDLLRIDGRRLLVHVHGETDAVYEPERLSRSALSRLARAAAVAATLALGGASAAAAGAGDAGASVSAGTPAPIEVRVRPPAPVVPPRVPMDCTIKQQQTSRNGPLVLHATCPKPPRGLWSGSYGEILDPKTRQPLKNGRVRVKSVQGKKVVVEAVQLRKRVRATKIRFMVR